jgi:hypothetical protein
MILAGLELLDIFVPALVTAKAMDFVPVLDPDVRILRDKGAADRILDHDPVGGKILVFFGFDLSLLFLVSGKQLK